MTSYIDDLVLKYSSEKEKKDSENFEKKNQENVESKNSFENKQQTSFSDNNSGFEKNENNQDDSIHLKNKMLDLSKAPTDDKNKKNIKEDQDIFETEVSKQNKQDALSKLKSLENNKDIKSSEVSGTENQPFEKQEENIKGSTLVTKYGDVKVYRLDSQSILHYSVPVPKPNPSQKIIINTLKEATTRLISSDPYKIRDPLQRRNIYYQKIIDILENAQEINIPKHLYPFYADAVVKEMTGYGVIEPLISDDKLEEIMIVGPKKPVYVYHIDYGMMTTNIVFYSDEGINEIIDKIARSIGRNVDISSPLLDARLPDGSRVNATIPPASIDGSTVTIRKFREDPYTIVDLIKFKTLNLEVASFLWCVVDGFGAKPANILISGGTGSGKTTTLNVLANFIPESDRILTIEDTAELKLPIKHVIRFEGRPPGLEGKGELSLEILTKNTLRMRPDRIVVGEIRHKEATTLFTAMNTGHDGCMGTVHANSAKETIIRLTSPPMNVPSLMLAGIDFIIIQKRLRTAKGQVRRITAIAEILGVLEGDPKINLIFVWNPETDTLERTKEPIKYFELIKTYTNFSDQDIKERIASRAEILEDLIEKKIRSIEDVSNRIQKEYILKR
jgi:archaeal flagellar protein FlaI